MSRPTSLWHHRDFMRLWAGETVSVFGSMVTYLALPLVAVLTLHASAFEMGVLAAAGMLPWLLFALLVGVWIDRRPRRRWILIASDLGQAVLLASVPLAAALDALTLAQLLVVAFLTGVLALFFRVAYVSYLPVLVAPEQLVEGNSKLMASFAAAQIGGPSIAGLLVQAITAPFAIVVDALSFLVSAAMLTTIETREPERTLEHGETVWEDLTEGLHLVVRDPLQRAIAGSAATLNFFGLAQLSIIVLYASKELGMSPGLIGAAFAAGAIGGLAGAICAGRVSARLGLGPTILWATVGFPICLAIVPLASPRQAHWLSFAILTASEFVGGIAVMLFDVNTASLKQLATPPHLLGRLSGAMSFLTQSAKPLGALFAGALASSIGLHPTLWVCAAGGLLVIPWTVFSPLRGRRIESADGSRGPDDQPAARRGQDRDRPVRPVPAPTLER
jgi:MFS family permease